MEPGRGKRGQDGGQRGGPRKKGKYISSGASHSSNQAIPLGSVGVFVTCDSGRERKASLQLIPFLEQYYDELAGAANGAAAQNTGDSTGISDIRSQIEAEVQDSKSVDKFRFKVCDTGVRGCAFIRFPAEGGASPQDVTAKILRQVEASKELPSPFLSRLLPVTHTCHANIDDILEMAKIIIPLHFPEGEGVEGCSFSVEYEHRSCSQFDRMSVINAFADIVPKTIYKVDLTKPKRSVLVQISRNVCAASVVDDYKTLAKYNIRKLAEVDEEGGDKKKPAQKTAAVGKDGGDGKKPTGTTAEGGEDIVDDAKLEGKKTTEGPGNEVEANEDGMDPANGKQSEATAVAEDGANGEPKEDDVKTDPAAGQSSGGGDDVSKEDAGGVGAKPTK